MQADPVLASPSISLPLSLIVYAVIVCVPLKLDSVG